MESEVVVMDSEKILTIVSVALSGAALVLGEIQKNKKIEKEVAKQLPKLVKEGLK